MLQNIGAALVFFGVFPLLAWAAPGLLGLGWAVPKALALIGCAYASAFAAFMSDLGLMEKMHGFDSAPLVCGAASVIFFLVMNGVAARLLYKPPMGRAIALGVATSVLLLAAGFASLVILLQGVSFC